MKAFRFIGRLIGLYLVTGLCLALPAFAWAGYAIARGTDTGIVQNLWSAFLTSLILLVYWPQVIWDNYHLRSLKLYPDYTLLIVFTLGLIYVIVRTLTGRRSG